MLTVKDIMTRPVVMIRSSATVESAIELMHAKGVRSLIIDKCHAEGSFGILTEKDIVYRVIAQGDDPAHVRVCSIMRQPCIQVPVGVTVQAAAQLLAADKIHRAPVIEHHEILGIISVTDILAKGRHVSLGQDELARPNQAALPQDPMGNDEAPPIETRDTARQIFEDRHLRFAATV
ncbi:MAG: CBS domain-containing protein [Cyanobacteria bacterium P01_D01_bin.44]